jgi:hypothetical protein
MSETNSTIAVIGMSSLSFWKYRKDELCINQKNITIASAFDYRIKQQHCSSVYQKFQSIFVMS